MIITIDGPSGSGKSTIAKKVAKVLGYTYFDTGAMYRMVAYALLKNKIDIKSLSAIEQYLSIFQFALREVDDKEFYYLNDEDVTEKIRSIEVTKFSSQVASLPIIREYLVTIQRDFGKKHFNAVFEGRDMGTVVFPESELKFFLTASVKIRAERRYLELLKKKKERQEDLKEFSLESIQKSIEERDLRDSTRELSPLKQATDASFIDTSEFTIEKIVDKILDTVYKFQKIGK